MSPGEWMKIRHLADNLIATAEPNKFWDEINELSVDECKVLDELAFECQSCNQWYAISDRHGEHEFECSSCYDGSNNEGDIGED